MQILYIDRLFLLNLLTDYLLLLLAGRLSGLLLRRTRYLLGALFGAVYAVAVFLPGLGFLASPLCKFCAALLMGLAAFGAETKPLRCTAVFLAVSAAFGGALWAVSLAGGGSSYTPPAPDLPTLALSFAICYALLRLLFRARAVLAEKQRVEVCVSFLGREARFRALVDTGNALTDPATGAPVLVADPRALAPLLREHGSLFRELSPVELLEYCAHTPALAGKFRLLPYHAMGGGGLLPVFHPDRLLIDGAPAPTRLVAVSPDVGGDGFDAVL